MMEAEMDDHLGYEKSELFDSDDYTLEKHLIPVGNNILLLRQMALTPVS